MSHSNLIGIKYSGKTHLFTNFPQFMHCLIFVYHAPTRFNKQKLIIWLLQWMYVIVNGTVRNWTYLITQSSKARAQYKTSPPTFYTYIFLSSRSRNTSIKLFSDVWVCVWCNIYYFYSFLGFFFSYYVDNNFIGIQVQSAQDVEMYQYCSLHIPLLMHWSRKHSYDPEA